MGSRISLETCSNACRGKLHMDFFLLPQKIQNVHHACTNNYYTFQRKNFNQCLDYYKSLLENNIIFFNN